MLQRAGERWSHGYQPAKLLADDGRRLVAHGTLYKALGRLLDAGLLSSHWEDADVARAAGRRRRRLYEISGAGQRALAAWERGQRHAGMQTRPGWEPT